MVDSNFFFQPPATNKTNTKVKTVKGTKGDDNLTSKSANEKIYLYAGNDTLAFKTTHGTDTVYAGEGNKTLSFTNNLNDIKVQRKGNNVILKTKNAKNKTETVTIKNYLKGTADITLSGADESKNLIEYFENTTYTFGNSKSKTSQTLNGSRLDNEIFNGGKAKDTINVYGGSGNIITAGKGNDKINLGNSSDNIVKIRKGDGKDTITFNDKVESDKVMTLYAPESDSVFYYKKGGDLLIKFNQGKTTESVTIKNAFDNEGKLSEKLYISFDNGETEEALTDAMYLSLDASTAIDGYLAGTEYNDRIYCDKKDVNILDAQGDNVIVTNAKSNASILTGEGDDFFYVSSLDTITNIMDTGGNNEICIETNNFSDVFTLFDVASTNYEDDTSDKIAILNGANLSKVNIEDLNENKLKGVTINADGDYSVALINSKSGISDTIERYKLCSSYIEGEVKNYLDKYNETGYEGTAYQFLADSNVSAANKAELLNIYKALSVFDGKGLVIKEDSSNNHETRTIILNNDSSDTITMEGKFQDTRIVNPGKYYSIFNYIENKDAGVCDDIIKIPNYSLLNDARIELEPWAIDYSDMDNWNRYTTNYPEYFDLKITAFDKDKSGKGFTDYHNLEIANVFGTLPEILPTDGPDPYDYKIYLQDKDRVYELDQVIAETETEGEVTKYKNDNDVNYIAKRTDSNYISIIRGNENAITLAKTYSIVNVFSETNSYIRYFGGYANISSVNSLSNDSYSIVDFNKDSTVIINDVGSTVIPETDDNYGSNGDGLHINTGIDDFRIFFNVKKESAEARPTAIAAGEQDKYYSQSYDSDDLFIIHKNNMNSKNILFEKGYMNSSIAQATTEDALNDSCIGYYNADIRINKGVTIENMFSEEGKIEDFTSATAFETGDDDDKYTINFSMDTWVNGVKENVAAWLDTHTKYVDTMDVLENGSKSDINSLIAIYKNSDYLSVID